MAFAPANAAAFNVAKAQEQLTDLFVQQGELARAVSRTQDLIETLMPIAEWHEVPGEEDEIVVE